MNKSLILLSGGLDSLVCLGVSKDEYNVELAITFDYGQKSVNKEIQASKEICQYYHINHRVIKLDWLKDITQNALVENDTLPIGIDNPEQSVKAVWVPNRNGLFLNIAASFADSDNYTHIIIGANKEEAATFPDNTKEFIYCVNSEFEYSTFVKPKVVAPLINCTKNDIVRMALDRDIPLGMVQSCYDSTINHCGKCESCTRLKNALLYNKAYKYIKTLFKE